MLNNELELLIHDTYINEKPIASGDCTSSEIEKLKSVGFVFHKELSTDTSMFVVKGCVTTSKINTAERFSIPIIHLVRLHKWIDKYQPVKLTDDSVACLKLPQRFEIELDDGQQTIPLESQVTDEQVVSYAREMHEVYCGDTSGMTDYDNLKVDVKDRLHRVARDILESQYTRQKEYSESIKFQKELVTCLRAVTQACGKTFAIDIGLDDIPDLVKDSIPTVEQLNQIDAYKTICKYMLNKGIVDRFYASEVAGHVTGHFELRKALINTLQLNDNATDDEICKTVYDTIQSLGCDIAYYNQKPAGLSVVNFTPAEVSDMESVLNVNFPSDVNGSMPESNIKQLIQVMTKEVKTCKELKEHILKSAELSQILPCAPDDFKGLVTKIGSDLKTTKEEYRELLNGLSKLLGLQYHS